MEKLSELLDTPSQYSINSIEYKQFDNIKFSQLYVVDKFILLAKTKNKIVYEYERKIYVSREENSCIVVSIEGHQPVKATDAKSSFEKYSEQQILEEIDRILKDLPSRASLIVSTIFNFVYSLPIITPPKYLSQSFKI